MTILETALVALQASGVAYVFGGVMAGQRASAPIMVKTKGAGAVALDGDRQSWRIVSALLTIAVGAAMIWGREAAAALLGALLVQQGVYIARQTMAARSVARRGQAQAHAPSLTTRMSFVVTAAFAALAAWLDAVGALN